MRKQKTHRQTISSLIFLTPTYVERINYFLTNHNEDDIDLKPYRDMAKHQAKYN